MRVSAADDGSTSMRCDLAGGCGGGVDFGGVVTIDDVDFNIDAIVPPVTDSTTQVNLSVLTDTATSSALDALSTGGDTTLEAAITAISNANSSIAERFGIQGDITTLPIVDLTNPAAVAAASNNVLNFNLLSASIVEALIGGNPTLSIAAAVQNFATQFVSDGGLADTEDAASTSVTLAEILAQASAVIDAIQAADTDGLTNLATLENIIDTNQGLAQNGSTDPDPGTAVDPNLGDLDKAKALVQSLRDLQAATFVDAEAFADRVELASNSLDGDAGYVLQALVYTAEAIASARDAYEADTDLTTFTDPDTNIIIAIAATDTEVTYTVDATVNVGTDPNMVAVAVDISAVDNNSDVTDVDGTPVANDDGSSTSTDTASAMVDLDIWGTASSASVSLQIISGDVALMATASEVETTAIPGINDNQETTNGSTEVFDADLTSVVFDLEVSMSEVSSSVVTDPVTFTGDILLSISNVTVDSSETGTYVPGNDGPVSVLDTWDETITFDELVLAISGEFEAPSGASLSASVRVTADGTDFSFNCVGSDSRDFVTGAQSESDVCTEESDSNFVDITANITAQIEVPGISSEEDVTLSVIATRTGADDADLLVIVDFDATLLTIALNSASLADDATESSLTVANESGVVLSLTQTETNGASVVSGNITVDGVEHATISDDQGTVVVSYTDGFNESF